MASEAEEQGRGSLELAPAPAASGGSSLFTDPAFGAAWAMGALTGITRWMETLVIGIYVFDQTESPFMVAAITLVRLAPLSLFSAFMGVFGDRFGRRRLIGFGIGAMAGLYGLLLVLAWSGTIALWHLAVAAFLIGTYWAADLPLRRTLVGEIAGTGRVGTAMSLDAATNNVTRMLGPIIGGVVYKLAGLEGAFALSAVLFAAAGLFQSRLPMNNAAHAATASVFANLLEGFAHVRSNRPLIGVLVITVIFNIWGFPFTAMIPVIGKDVLGLGPLEVGLLSGAEGIGALVTAAAIAFLARVSWYRRIFFYGTCFHLALVLCFSFSTSVALSAVLMIAIGLGAACFSTMQSTLAFLSAPPAVRGRIMGVVSVCIGTGPIGFAHLGLLAHWLGAPAALAVMVVEGLLFLAVCFFRLPGLRS
ncbi:MAG: MFS transporter [Alphaproteobacteria bacterium]|nr:MFS transporter [Alphaproteobacteria bacterium]